LPTDASLTPPTLESPCMVWREVVVDIEEAIADELNFIATMKAKGN
jgi:hypothetical protein